MIGVVTMTCVSKKVYEPNQRNKLMQEMFFFIGFLFFLIAIHSTHAQSINVYTLAGSGSTSPTAVAGTGTYATFYGPYGITVIPDGSIYVSDYYNGRIRKITLAGAVSNYAGQSVRGSTNGPVSSATFNYPCGLTSDPSGNLYIADSGSHLIRKIDTTLNIVSTFAGSRQGTTNGQALNARFNGPRDIARDAYGNFFVADYGNQRIRLIDTALTVYTYAGTGTMGNTDGPISSATLNNPISLTIDSLNVIYFADGGSSRIRRIKNQIVSTLAGSSSGLNDAAGTYSKFSNPFELAVDSTSSRLYVADSGNSRIRMINLSNNVVSTFVGQNSGFNDGASTAALLNGPQGVAFDSTGNVIVGDTANNRIRRIVQCLTGTKWNLNTKTCVSTSCPAGQEFDSVSITCKYCQLGFFKNAIGSGPCAQCGTGTESSSDWTACVNCGLGEYRPSLTFDSCISCPQNSVCNTISFQCMAGYKYDSVTNGCLPCPQYTYKDAVGNGDCQPCPLGTAYVSSTLCQECDAGSFRSNLTMNSCISCPVASVCNSVSFTCIPGYTVNALADDCILCDLGKFKPTQSNDVCMYCPVGTESSADRQSCLPCSVGTFRSLLSQSTCISCPTYASCNTTAFQCVQGYEPNALQSDCIKCNVGFYKNVTGNLACSQCPAGTQYVSETTCESCSPGTYRSDLTQLSCVNCPSNSDCFATGFLCQSGYSYNAVSKTCDKCAKNFFKASSSNSNCNQCPLGTVSSNDNTGCNECFAGTFRSNFTMDDCISCPTNSQCLPTGFSCLASFQYNSTLGTCDMCPLNYFKYNLGNGQCTQCPIGTVSNLNRTACDTCSSGKYRNTLTSSSCIVCPGDADCFAAYFTCRPGFEFSNTALNCSRCLSGFAKSVSSNISCTRCGLGTEPNMNRTQCINCSPYSYKPSVLYDTCIGCPANATCNATSFSCNAGFTLNSTSAKCDQCSLGYAKDTVGNVPCNACPIGKQSSPDRRICESCPSGFYRSTLALSTCVTCPTFAICTATSFSCPASYKNTGTACELCPLGTEVSASGNQCTTCLSGKQRSALTMTSCQSCPKNSNCTATMFACEHGYQISNDGISCEACPAGYVKNGYNNTKCTQCALRQEPNTSRSVCQDCAPLFFKPSLALTGCISCTSGVSCNSTIYSCLPGFTVDSAASFTCKQCEEGFYKSLDGISDCLACPPSKFSSGTFASCVSCSLGFFRADNATSCEKCLIGTESNDIRDGCKICDMGTYRPTLEYNKCIACPTGAICTTTEFRCLEGWWINGSGKGCTNVPDNVTNENTFYGVPMDYILMSALIVGTVIIFTLVLAQYKKRNLVVSDMNYLERRSLSRRIKQQDRAFEAAADDQLFHEIDKSDDKLAQMKSSSIRNSPSILRRLSFSQDAKESKRSSKYGHVDSSGLLNPDASS